MELVLGRLSNWRIKSLLDIVRRVGGNVHCCPLEERLVMDLFVL